jgi:hypothetical protein
MDKGNDKTNQGLMSDDFSGLAVLLAPRLVALEQSAREGHAKLPIEVRVIDAEENTIFHASYEAGTFRNISGLPDDMSIIGRFHYPLTVALSDAAGWAKELTVEPDQTMH